MAAPTLSIGNLARVGLGVRAQTQASLSAFENLIGVDAAGVLGFADEATPARSLARVLADAPALAALDRPVNWAIPLAWPGISMASVASGAHDGTLRAIAEAIAQHQTADVNPLIYVRPGWEATNAYPWKVFSGTNKVFDEALAQDYVDAFRHVATLFRSVDDRFRVEWNQNYSNKDATNVFYDLNKIYPGDRFVDVVGVDAYNVQRFPGQEDPVAGWGYKASAPFGLNWFSSFAASHGKPLALTEWGIDSDGFGYYVDKLAEFVRTNNVIYTHYWNADAKTNGNDTLTDGSKPATAAAVASEFGSRGSSALLPGKQSGPIVERGVAPDGSHLAGTASAFMWAIKADPDGDAVRFDTAGWSVMDPTHVTKNGIYGSVILNTSTGAIKYTLDDARAVTNALGDKMSATDAFSLTVRDAGGASATQQIRFTITGTKDGGGSSRTLETKDLTVAKTIAEFQSYDRIVTFDTAAAAMNPVSLKLINAGTIDLTAVLDGERPVRVAASPGDTTIVTASGADTLIGGAGDDVLKGMAGNDTIDGRGGADEMHGGIGADTYYVDNTGDRIIERAGQGVDTVRTGFTHTLSMNVENLVVLYSGDAWATGNELDNRITGNGGSNVLKGMAGNDTLDGGTGVDVMYGGTGNDLFVFDNAADEAIEYAGQGVDTVRTGFTHTLAADVENLELLHTGDAWGTGNGSNNEITGNAGNNVLKGMAGNDTLDGGAGVDVMYGGTGNDLFVFNNAADEAIEYAGQGVDTVRTGFTHTLAANVENLELLYSGDAWATGNGANNRIVGNAGDNVLKGMAGNDALTGGPGNDTFVFTGALNAATNRDTITDFSVADDMLALDSGVFTVLGGPGGLAAGSFHTGTAAADAGDRVIYNPATGTLIYDSNGSATGGSVQFADIGTGKALGISDFTVV